MMMEGEINGDEMYGSIKQVDVMDQVITILEQSFKTYHQTGDSV